MRKEVFTVEFVDGQRNFSKKIKGSSMTARNTVFSFLGVALVVVFLLGLSVGSVNIPLSVVLKGITKGFPFFRSFTGGEVKEGYLVILFNLRLPRVLLCVLVGAGLACAGCCMQGLFRNPMASPYVIGISSGASFGAALALLILPGIFSLPFAAFVSGVGTAFLVYRISQVKGKIPIERLLLSGIAVGFFFSAVTSFLMYIAAQDMHRLFFWIMGGFWASSWIRLFVAIPFIGFGIPGIFFFSRDLNIMQLGEESAITLGVEVELVKGVLLVLSSLIVAACVSVSGVIGFVGLIIPHLTRLFVGPDHRVLIPASSLVGGIFLAGCDILARTVVSPAELPVGIITSCFGAPFFIYLLTRRRW
ncbi:iron ABC transporter permease [Candidatus Aerophobetes bacterium]|nr:iron ABC transporter permease [Candidatus Aerophobetes bacterium]